MNEETTVIDMNTGVYDWPFFNIRLREERRRTERSGSPFSLLTLDISDLIEKRPKLKIHQMKKVITNIVRENTRDIDIKGWHDDRTLNILMPETPISGAYLLAEKLQEKVNNGFRTFFGFDNVVDLKKNMLITSYPEAAKNSEEFSESEPLVAKKSVATSPGKWANKGKTTTILKMQWSPPNQMTLAWPLYSDLLEESALINVQKWIKRAIDIIGAVIGIVLFGPLMLIIATLTKITSPGPILFRQERMGFLGKKFIFLKFRSMFYNCDQAVHQEHVRRLANNEITPFENGKKNIFSYKLQNDERVTKIGRFLRRTSLDELPQLLNVLKGDMSLVGPRPYPVYQIENCSFWQHSRLSIKPGVTGLAQLYGRYNITYTDAYRLDLQYIKKWSLWLDFKILIKTVPLFISGRGAQ